MKKIAFTLLVSILSTWIINAQGISDISLYRLNDRAAEDDSIIDFDDPSTYSGSPYSNPDFVYGSILRNDSVIFKKVALRYNVINDQVEIKETIDAPNDTIRNLKKSAILEAKIGATRFIFMPYEGSVDKGDFLEIIYNGTQVDVYKKHVKEVQYPLKASTSITRDVPAKFTDKPLYFLVTRRQQFYQFPKSRKKKLKIFGDKEKQMKTFARKNKLDINKEEDLVSIVSHYEKQ